MLNEHKINEIAEAVDGIKQLLQGRNLASLTSHDPVVTKVSVEKSMLNFSPSLMQPSYNEAPDSALDHHSVQVGQFVNDFLEGGMQSRTDSDDASISLRNFVTCPTKRVTLKGDPASNPSRNGMPPIEAAVFMLRWARGMCPSKTYVCMKLISCRAPKVLPGLLAIADPSA